MAATLSHPLVRRPWAETQRPQSQPGPDSLELRRAERRSPNPMKASPADPGVINTILDSFDTLASPSIITADDHLSDTRSWRSRPHTADETYGSRPGLVTPTSPGFGVEYGMGLSLNDESGVSNAALPPTVGTSRDPMALSSYQVKRTPSFRRDGSGLKRRSSSFSSVRNSFSMRRNERERLGKYKLSSESWVKQGSMSQDSLGDDWKKRSDLSLARLGSEESLKPPRSRLEASPSPSKSSNPSRAEQIIALASVPRPGSKRRLYLTDTGSIDERSVAESSTVATEPPEVENKTLKPFAPQPDNNVDSAVQQILDEYIKLEEEQKITRRRSSEKSPIVDSIPMRTSSLRQSSSSPGPGKRKSRKSKHLNDKSRESSLSGVVSRKSKNIPESSWADLGEDDETVKRIRELREQRMSRMLEPQPSPVRGISPATQSEFSSVASTNGQKSTGQDNDDDSARVQPEASRSFTEPILDTDHVFGTENDLSVPVVNGQHLNGNTTNGNATTPSRWAGLTPGETRLQIRPSSARSNISTNPPLSLDYSYTDAVDALHDVRRQVTKDSQSTPASPTSPISPLTPTQKPGHRPTKSQGKKGAANARTKGFRWKTPVQYPDSPFDFNVRRRSTSDARQARQFDNDSGQLIEERDSVDLAVDEYLHASRLNRRIKHPLTGRVISFSEVGDPEGAAVIVCMGMGLTRYVSAFYDELAATLRLRLVTIDRPGVGNSEPYPATDKSGPLSWPDDVLAVCQHLGITKFSMLAHSAGAVYALATALILPHLIKGRLHLMAPWIPPSQLEMFSNPADSSSPGALPRSQRFLRVLPAPFLKAANASFMTAASASLKPGARTKTEPRRPEMSSPPSRGRERPSTGGREVDQNRRESLMLMDQFMPEITPTEAAVTPTQPNFDFASNGVHHHPETRRKHEYTTLLTQRTWDLATRDSNPAYDLLVCLERYRDVGFRYTDVHHEVVITHGSEDKRVPVANVKWLAEQMNRHALAFGGSRAGDGTAQGRAGLRTEALASGGCEIRVLEGEGHGLMASPLIMGDILTEIAESWRV